MAGEILLAAFLDVDSLNFQLKIVVVGVTYLSKVFLLKSVAVELLTLAVNGGSAVSAVELGQTNAGYALEAVGMRGAC